MFCFPHPTEEWTGLLRSYFFSFINSHPCWGYTALHAKKCTLVQNPLSTKIIPNIDKSMDKLLIISPFYRAKGLGNIFQTPCIEQNAYL